jgi:transposase InsO family protein
MWQYNLRSKIMRKFKATTNSHRNFQVVYTLFDQNLNAQHPSQIWGDNLLWPKEGWLYLAAILDFIIPTIVGWAMGSTMIKQLVIDAINQAVERHRPPKGITFHFRSGIPICQP